MEVWPEHRQAFEAFVRCQTQWRVVAGVSGMIHVGLDYTAVQTVMDMMGVSDRLACFDAIRCLEVGARASLNA